MVLVLHCNCCIPQASFAYNCSEHRYHGSQDALLLGSSFNDDSVVPSATGNRKSGLRRVPSLNDLQATMDCDVISEGKKTRIESIQRKT